MRFLFVLLLASSAFAQSVSGNWQWDLSRGHSQYVATLRLASDASGTLTVQAGKQGSAAVQEYAISDGQISGNTVAFTVDMPSPDGPLPIEYYGTVSGSSMVLAITYPSRNGSPQSVRTVTAARQ